MYLLKPTTKIIESDGQYGQFLQVPPHPYTNLKEDFEMATHLSKIDEVNFSNINGIYIRALNESDALLAALYGYKKYVYDNRANMLEPELYDDIDDFDLPSELFDVHDDGSFSFISIVNGRDFIDVYGVPSSEVFGHHNFAFQKNPPTDYVRPIWRQVENPIIINAGMSSLQMLQKAVENQNRFVILYEAWHSYESSMFGSMKNNYMELNPMQKSFLFESNFEEVRVSKAPLLYLTSVMQQMIVQEEYTLAPNVDSEKIMKELMQYRAGEFQGIADVERLIRKATRYTEGSEMTEVALLQFFRKQVIEEANGEQENSASKHLDALIGLHDVKRDLTRLVERMKFVEKRKQVGHSNMDHHMAAVFMGNPGTAKTTVARIFGQMLFEANVLTNNVFSEVSRKDLIGMYVGWTANKVQQVFDEAKGGTIFIDEAYSLMDGNTNSYSEEAFAAIIQNMENNPDTLVIFAGYTDEMITFIQQANPGLQSRLTNIIQFDDYSSEQLHEIFLYHVQKADYKLEDEQQVGNIIRKFVATMEGSRNGQAGNGRLMRKLLSTSVGYMAARNPDNFQLLTVQDVQFACDELVRAEQTVFARNSTIAIGFNRGGK